jgi:hypothetical protein
MISVLVQVRSDVACLKVAIRAESIREALSVAEARYPGAEPRLVYPIAPEAFFVRDPSVGAGVVEVGVLEGAIG